MKAGGGCEAAYLQQEVCTGSAEGRSNQADEVDDDDDARRRRKTVNLTKQTQHRVAQVLRQPLEG
jgi:hypothetical protein